MGAYVDSFKSAWPDPGTGFDPSIAVQIVKYTAKRLRALAAMAGSAGGIGPGKDALVATKVALLDMADRFEATYKQAVIDAKSGKETHYARKGLIYQLWQDVLTMMERIEQVSEEIDDKIPGILARVGSWMAETGQVIGKIASGVATAATMILSNLPFLLILGGALYLLGKDE